MPKCFQCDRPAIFGMGPRNEIPLCLEHSLMLQQFARNGLAEDQRMMNFLMDSMDFTVGLPAMGPRFPDRTEIQMSGVTFNNINVDRSTIGVLNTGSIGSVDVAISSVRDAGDVELADALRDFTQAVVNDTEATAEVRNELLELLGVIASEATVPQPSRRKRAIWPLIQRISEIARTAAALKVSWDLARAVLERAFDASGAA